MDVSVAHKIIGVEPGVSWDTVREKYGILIKKYHPDINKNPNAHDRAAEINSAYRILKQKHEEAFLGQRQNNQDSHNKKQVEYLCRHLGMSYESLMKEYEQFMLKNKNSNLSIFSYIERKKTIKELCEQLGESSQVMGPRYNKEMQETFPNSRKTFVEWLKDQIIIKDICGQLGKTSQELRKEYEDGQKSFIKPISITTSFFDWLMEKLTIVKLCARLGRDLRELETEFEREKINPIYGFKLSFTAWLREQVLIKNLCNQLGITIDQAKREYGTLVATSQISSANGFPPPFMEWLQKRIATEKKVKETVMGRSR